MSVRVPGGGGGGLPIRAGHLFIIGAIVMAVISAVLLKSVVTTGKDDKKKTPPIAAQKIVVISDYVPAGTVVNGASVKMVDWPKKYLPAGSYFKTKNEVVGRTAKYNLMPGEPLYKEKLTGDKSTGGMPVMIPAGHRAITIAVNEIKSVAGFVRPGDRVDVLLTVDIEAEAQTDETSATGSSKRTEIEKVNMTRTILQNSLVLAAAQKMVQDQKPRMAKVKGLEAEEEEAAPTDKKGKKDDKKKKEKSAKEIAKEKKEEEKARQKAEKKSKSVSSITLAVLPEDAEMLAVAERMGNLQLILRPEGDISQRYSAGTPSPEVILPNDVDSLNYRWKTAFTKRTDGTKKTVEVIQGTKTQYMDF